jgi:hypothetical protein
MNESLNPYYVTGLVEGEGSFCVSFNIRERLKIKIETKASFSISLNRKDLELLKMVQDFFKCGSIRYSNSDRTYKYEVRSITDIKKKIIPHFEKYPLKGKKAESFRKFSIICEKIHSNLHLNREHLKEIIELAYDMNYGKRKYNKDYLLKLLVEMKV